MGRNRDRQSTDCCHCDAHQDRSPASQPLSHLPHLFPRGLSILSKSLPSANRLHHNKARQYQSLSYESEKKRYHYLNNLAAASITISPTQSVPELLAVWGNNIKRQQARALTQKAPAILAAISAISSAGSESFSLKKFISLSLLIGTR